MMPRRPVAPILASAVLTLTTLSTLTACSGGDAPSAPAASVQTLTLSLTPTGGVGAVLLELGPIPSGGRVDVPAPGAGRYVALESPSTGVRRLLLIGDALGGTAATVTLPAGAAAPTATVREVADTANAELPTASVTVSWSGR